jgi:hypothetical protein
VRRVSAEQAAIESRLIELDGMENISTGLQNTKLNGEEDMNVDLPPKPPSSRTLDAKRKALSMFVCRFKLCSSVYAHKGATRHLHMGHLLQGVLACKRQLAWNVKHFCKIKSDRRALRRRSVVSVCRSGERCCQEKKKKHEYGHSCEQTFCPKRVQLTE